MHELHLYRSKKALCLFLQVPFVVVQNEGQNDVKVDVVIDGKMLPLQLAKGFSRQVSKLVCSNISIKFLEYAGSTFSNLK